MEKRTDMLISTLSSYVQALGGTLEVRASFPDGKVYRHCAILWAGQNDRRRVSRAFAQAGGGTQWSHRYVARPKCDGDPVAHAIKRKSKRALPPPDKAYSFSSSFFSFRQSSTYNYYWRVEEPFMDNRIALHNVVATGEASFEYRYRILVPYIVEEPSAESAWLRSGSFERSVESHAVQPHGVRMALCVCEYFRLRREMLWFTTS